MGEIMSFQEINQKKSTIKLKLCKRLIKRMTSSIISKYSHREQVMDYKATKDSYKTRNQLLTNKLLKNKSFKDKLQNLDNLMKNTKFKNNTNTSKIINKQKDSCAPNQMCLPILHQIKAYKA